MIDGPSARARPNAGFGRWRASRMMTAGPWRLRSSKRPRRRRRRRRPVSCLRWRGALHEDGATPLAVHARAPALLRRQRLCIDPGAGVGRTRADTLFVVTVDVARVTGRRTGRVREVVAARTDGGSDLEAALVHVAAGDARPLAAVRPAHVLDAHPVARDRGERDHSDESETEDRARGSHGFRLATSMPAWRARHGAHFPQIPRSRPASVNGR